MLRTLGRLSLVDRRACDSDSGSALPATNLARGSYVAVQRRPHFVRVVIRQIDFVPAPIEGEVDRFAAVDDLSVVQVVDEPDNRTLRHHTPALLLFPWVDDGRA